MEPTRTCTKCGVEKPLESFPRASRYRDGRSTRCRTCKNAYNRRWKADSGKRLPRRCGRCGTEKPRSAFRRTGKTKRAPWCEECYAETGTKYCAVCETAKPVSAFNKDRHNSDGLSYHCKICISERNREQRRADPEADKLRTQRRAARYERERTEQIIPKFKACSECGVTKPISAFSKSRLYKDGH